MWWPTKPKWSHYSRATAGELNKHRTSVVPDVLFVCGFDLLLLLVGISKPIRFTMVIHPLHVEIFQSVAKRCTDRWQISISITPTAVFFSRCREKSKLWSKSFLPPSTCFSSIGFSTSVSLPGSTSTLKQIHCSVSSFPESNSSVSCCHHSGILSPLCYLTLHYSVTHRLPCLCLHHAAFVVVCKINSPLLYALWLAHSYTSLTSLSLKHTTAHTHALLNCALGYLSRS